LAARWAAVRVCRIDRGSKYSRGAVASLGAIGRRKLLESSVFMIKEGKSTSIQSHRQLENIQPPVVDGCKWRIRGS
jgi:hypothetical protein